MHSLLLQDMQDRLQVPSQGVAFSRDSASAITTETSFTVGTISTADAATVAEEIVKRSLASGIHFDPDVTLTLGTIVVTHEEKPRFVPVRAKYDTASDVNFVPLSLVEKNGLSEFLVRLNEDANEDNVFVGINNQEYTIHHTITLKWSAATMHNIRTTYFHVAEDLPFDMVLGNPFIQDNQVFHPQRVALPLRHKHRSSGKSMFQDSSKCQANVIIAQREEEKKNQEASDLAAAEKQQQERSEDARKRALEREAKRLAKLQTSASASASMNPMNLHSAPTVSVHSAPSLMSHSTSYSNTASPTPVSTNNTAKMPVSSSVSSPIQSSSATIVSQSTAPSLASPTRTNSTVSTGVPAQQPAGSNP